MEQADRASAAPSPIRILLAEGLSNKESATRLILAEGTIKKPCTSMHSFDILRYAA
jgi:DNA-binding NarL/FixJ family response regulator